ncbi:TolC family protein [Nitrosophilus kaiyonis]|uniref:TolC family protein n=1 Tax=Nitrosophilus kaiyonis TaxID=2930200 RepID=UPI0024915565|nr:TolC family protein [Nitrosophilus kaiyonis]
MKKKIFILFSFSLLYCDESILSSLKQKEFDIDYKKSEVESKKLRDSWINPINMSYIKTKNDQYGLNSETKSFKISIDQPIFKSGGIYFAIKYADANKEFSKLSIKEREKELIAKALDLLYKYYKTKLMIEKQKLLIENAKIDVLRKKEQYLSGFLDSSFLDQAILNKNQQELKLLELQDSLNEIYKNFKNISDKEPDNIKLPHFTIINKDEYLEKNIAIKKYKEDEKVKKYFKNMTIARYLPSFSLTASYNEIENKAALFMPSGKESYKEYGFKITMPLFDINSFRNIESTKLDFLKSKILKIDNKREELNRYEITLKKIKILDKKINLAKEDIKLYSSLLQDTKSRYEAGEKTIYDVDTLKNSLDNRKIDIKIYEIEKQENLLEIYKRVVNG